MSDWSSPDRPRPVRILALHSSAQSAASLRAQLAPLINQLPQCYEFHFLEAGYCVADDSRRGGSVEERDLVNGVLLCSRLEALRAEAKALRSTIERSSPADDSEQKEAQEQLYQIDADLERVQSQLNSTMYREVRMAFQRGGIEEAEALLAKHGFLSLDRDWFIEAVGEDKTASASTMASSLGLQGSIDRLGDYLREKGPFHFAIGSGSGYSLLRLLSLLLSEGTHPASAVQYPLLFPLLPSGGSGSQGGGWAIRGVQLPNGQRHASMQPPFDGLLRIGWRERGGVQDEVQRWRSQAPLIQQPHSLAILHSDVDESEGDEQMGVSPRSDDSNLLSSEALVDFVKSYIRAVCSPLERASRTSSTQGPEEVGLRDEIIIRWDRRKKNKEKL